MAYAKKTKKTKRQVDTAVVHIKSTFNNTLVTVTTPEGDVLLRGSAGAHGFKGSRKATPYAAGQVGTQLGRNMLDLGVRNVEVDMQGAGSGRESVVRAIQAAGININVLRDVTPLPHNGPRAPKKRRV